MRSFATFAVLSSAVGFAAANAIAERGWDYPESYKSFKIAARQADPEPGTPRYACHENCGLAIQLGRETENHCSDSEWNSKYNACLQCANTFEIWIYYGRSVTAYAGECGLTPQPSPSGWEAEAPATSAPAPVTSAPAAVTTSSAAPVAPVTTSSPAAVASSAAAPIESVISAIESAIASAVSSGAAPVYPVPGQSTTLVSSAAAVSSSAAASVAPSASGNGTIPEPSIVPSAAGNVAASVGMVGVAALVALAL